MGYNANASAAPASNNVAPFGRGQKEEAKGFLNMYLPTDTGGRVKFGLVACRDDDKTQKAAMDYLREATDEEEFKGRLLNLITKMQFEFNWNEKKAVTLAL